MLAAVACAALCHVPARAQEAAPPSDADASSASSSSSSPAATEPPPDARALFAAGRYAEASSAFFALWERDHANTGALFNAAISARKADLLEDARRAYDTLLTSTPEDLDAVYGLADVEQRLGATEHARALLTRYVAEETRPARGATVERARAALAALDAPAPTPTPTPTVVEAAPAPAPAVPAVLPDVPAAAAVEVPAGAPAIHEDGEPMVSADPVPSHALSTSSAAQETAPSSTLQLLPFAGDVLAAHALVQQARVALDRSDAAGARALLARAIALAPADAAAVALDARAAASEGARCSVDEAVARGERALAVRDAAAALRAFQRARVCAPDRAAPLWGLARAWEAQGDAAQARRHARLYVASHAPDRDAALAARAARRLEQPDGGVDN